MTIDEAEAVIAATSGHPATIDFVFALEGLAKKRCGGTNRTSVAVRVLGRRLRVQTGDGEQTYFNVP